MVTAVLSKVVIAVGVVGVAVVPVVASPVRVPVIWLMVEFILGSKVDTVVEMALKRLLVSPLNSEKIGSGAGAGAGTAEATARRHSPTVKATASFILAE